MALFKHFRGKRSALDLQEKHDGYAYFCTDDGSFHIDYVDADGNLQRKQVNASELEALGYDINQIEEEISPLTEAEIDALWTETPGMGGVPTFSMTTGFVPKWNGTTFEDGVALNNIATTSEMQAQEIVFRYFSLATGEKYAIKKNGFYLIYCNNAKLKFVDNDGTEEVSGAKQIQLMAAPIDGDAANAARFKACGMYYTGSFSLTDMGVEGFRRTVYDGCYITTDDADGLFVCEMVKRG